MCPGRTSWRWWRRSPRPRVRREVRRVADAWVKGSGAIVTAAQTMLPDVPWENVVALVEEITATACPARGAPRGGRMGEGQRCHRHRGADHAAGCALGERRGVGGGDHRDRVSGD